MAAPRRERKVVTVLFADLVGFTARAEELDPEDVEAILRPYHERLRSELERFGGTVEKFIGDAVIALFGASGAHEDDPERAVRAALAIRDWLGEQDRSQQVRIAVATGQAHVTLGAPVTEGEPVAVGDVVNTAARLQLAAPGDDPGRPRHRQVAARLRAPASGGWGERASDMASGSLAPLRRRRQLLGTRGDGEGGGRDSGERSDSEGPSQAREGCPSGR